MSKVLVTESYLDDIADAIREQNGTENTYKPPQMAPAIRSLPVGGSAEEITYDNTSSGLDAENVQSAIDELESEKQDELTFDNEPTANSNNPVTSGGVYTALDGKVDKASGKGLSANDFTDADKTKLDGIESGAEVNVQSDWSQTDNSEDDFIKNKPTLGTAAAKNVTTAVTNGSSDLVTSGGVYSEMTGNNSNYGKYHLELYIDSDGDICQL